MWSAASLPATGWRTAICCCARARRTTPCSAAEGNDVHRPLRAGTGGETHRAAHLARHPVPGAEPGGPAVARVPAPRVGAGPRHRRSEEHTSELQSRLHLVCRLLLEKKKERYSRNAHVRTPRTCLQQI